MTQTAPSPDLAAALASYQRPAPAADKLTHIRARLAHYRGELCEIADAEERLVELKRSKLKLEHEELPALFQELGIERLDLPADGNQPATTFELKDYCKASISAEWPEEKRRAAFALLEELDAGSIIKNEYVILFDRTDHVSAKKFEQLLEKSKIDYVRRQSVPWGTLTSWLKAHVELTKKTPPLEVLGAVMGKIIKPKEKK